MEEVWYRKERKNHRNIRNTILPNTIFCYDTIRGISLNFKYDSHTPTWNFQMAFNSATINFILFIIDTHELTSASLTSLYTTSLTGTLFSSHIESHEVTQVLLHELCPCLPSYLLLCVHLSFKILWILTFCHLQTHSHVPTLLTLH